MTVRLIRHNPKIATAVLAAVLVVILQAYNAEIFGGPMMLPPLADATTNTSASESPTSGDTTTDAKQYAPSEFENISFHDWTEPLLD